MEPTSSRTAFEQRVANAFEEEYDKVLRRTDRLFLWLMVVQWGAAIVLALWLSPYAWAGRTSVVHGHVYAAVFLGGAISSLPILLALLQPGRLSTRYVIAGAQMLWSALLIHLSGGRIETHFHVFGSLAILAFYRDVKVLVPATLIVATDHFVRGLFWPESVYGVPNPEWWRFLEHAGWVVFIDVFLVMNCMQSYRELWDLCRRRVEAEESREKMLRVEKLAAVGELAASVGHELRNPLTAIGNAHAFIAKKVGDGNGAADARVVQFLGIIRRELDASAKIIANLLDFSRPRVPSRTPTPLRPLVDEAVGLVPRRDGVQIRSEVPETLPIPELDKDQIRQVLVNLVQNAVESIPRDQAGEVVVRASGGAGDRPWRITVEDTGVGIPPDAVDKIFQPLFSTKTKGTGLGLAVVSGMVDAHGGSVSVESAEGKGTTFIVELPQTERPAPVVQAAG